MQSARVSIATKLGDVSSGGSRVGCVLERWTLATSLKYSMAGKAPVDAFAPHMETFIRMMDHKDLDVKKATLLMINAAIHHQVGVDMRCSRRLVPFLSP